jgi:hypothetical protein
MANEKVNNKTQARRPAYYIEYQTFGKKGLGMGNSILFSLFISKVTVLLLHNVELNEQEKGSY